MYKATKKIKVSIVIPTYKPGTYLWDCIDSIYKQSIGLEKFELLIVLNGCHEPYLKNIREYLASKKGLNAELLQTDVPGVSNARNIGLTRVKGDYVCFIDDDDWISENYLRELMTVADNGADIVASNVACYSDETQELTEDYITRAFRDAPKNKDISILKARKFMSSSCCKIIRREKIGNTLFDCNFRLGEDSLFMASISCRIRSIRTSSTDAVYYRRLRKESASRTPRKLSERIRDSEHLAIAYTRILMSDCTHYNWLFFASRYVALLLHVFRGS